MPMHRLVRLIVGSAVLLCPLGPPRAQPADAGPAIDVDAPPGLTAPATEDDPLSPGVATPQADDEPQPTVLIADELTYDQELEVVIARGNVQLAQGQRLVRADTITYNRRTEVVTASGNVTVVEPTGELVFAEYAELTDDLATGFVDRVAVVLNDQSRMIGNAGVRTEGRYTEVERAVYSPCDLCPDDPRAAPIWQVRASRAIHDRESRDIEYRDAFLDIYGIPIAYTPYLSHPDGTVDRRSGVLPPRFGSTSSLGPFIQGQYYFDIAPEQDATVGLTATVDAGVQGQVEYRRRFEHGSMVTSGSINQSDREERGGVRREDALRWHVFNQTRFDLGQNWRAGADIQRTSDDTYLDVFEIDNQDVLESRAFAEGFYGLSYVLGEAISFQDLRRDVDVGQPAILPQLLGEYASEPGAILGGQVVASASVLNLDRPRSYEYPRTSLEGVDTRRLASRLQWQRQFFTSFGLVTEVRGALDTQLYWSDNLIDPVTGQRRDDVLAIRAFPRGTVEARWPFVRRQGTWQQLIEPVAAITGAPNSSIDNDIPNNDSVDPEFDENNLFSDNRFPGIDRIDGGSRINYGINAGVYGDDGGSTTLFLGQSYRFGDTSNFPERSGLQNRLSDVVGRLSIRPGEEFQVDYRFRLDLSDFAARRQELRMTVGPPVFQVNGSYTYVEGVSAEVTDTRQEITVGFRSQMSQYWSSFGSLRYDFVDGEARDGRIGVTYQDECFTFGTVLRRDFTSDRDVASGTSIFFNIVFRNLGEVPFQVL